MPETPVYERGVAATDICCICESLQGPFLQERRPTGRDSTGRAWFFCESCFRMLQEQRGDPDPWIAARYRIFLEYLAGHYDRRFNGNQASKIEPKKEKQ